MARNRSHSAIAMAIAMAPFTTRPPDKWGMARLVPRVHGVAQG
jgi:hypothetical protein